MTLVAAWVRSVRDVRELIVASDSRLSGGYRWDSCPKIFPLARSDALVAFAGDTQWSYPLMLQLNNAISIFARSRDRALDLQEMKTYALKVFNDMRREFRDVAHPSLEDTDVEFVIGGWSWVRQEFRIWHCSHDENRREFVARRAPEWGGSPVLFIGQDTAKEAYERLRTLLFKERSRNHLSIRFDYEPFEVLRDMLRAAGPSNSIGGPPQIYKAYQHMNVRGLGVWWPSKAAGRIAYVGRMLRAYEHGDSVNILDPDGLKTSSWPKFSLEEDLLVWRRRLLRVIASRSQ